MPLKLTFSKVVVLSFIRKSTMGTVKLSCSPTKTVLKTMGWGEVPDWQKSSTPAGKLTASAVEFTPTKPDLQKHAFQLDGASVVRDFEFIRSQVKQGKGATKTPSFRIELHFSVDFKDPEGARKLEGYQQSVDDSSMRVTYEKEPEQEELPMGGESTQETLISKEQAADTAKADEDLEGGRRRRGKDAQ